MEGMKQPESDCSAPLTGGQGRAGSDLEAEGWGLTIYYSALALVLLVAGVFA